MKYTQQEVNTLINKTIRKERGIAAALIFLSGILGILTGRCSNPVQKREVKSGVVAADPSKSFQPGDTIKVILIQEKQR